MSRGQRAARSSPPARLEGPEDWYRDAIIYELHVRAFADSNGDGVGDFNGLTHRLDYLADLGVTAIWLLPFYPSPLRDDGYDIADYRTVHPDYGDLRQFKRLLNAAHDRNIRVITELVVNHTSDQHPWFQRARHAPAGSPERDFYVWSDHPDRYADARIIFSDFETSNWTWDPVAERLLLAPLLLPPARPQLRQPRRRGRRHRHARLLARHGRRRPAPRRRAVPPRARGHQLREPPRDPRGAQAAAQAHGRPLPGPHAAGRGQPVARGRRVVLRRRRRVPHELPLPGDAAAVHGPAPRAPHADRRHHGADARSRRPAASGRRSCATTTS